MASGTRHLRYSHIGPTCDSNAIILILHRSGSKKHVGSRRDIETIRIVRCRLSSAQRISRVAGSIVHVETGDRQAVTACDIKAVDGPVLNVQVFDDAVYHFVQDNKVVRSAYVSALELKVERKRLTWHCLHLSLAHPNNFVRSHR